MIFCLYHTENLGDLDDRVSRFGGHAPVDHTDGNRITKHQDSTRRLSSSISSTTD